MEKKDGSWHAYGEKDDTNEVVKNLVCVCVNRCCKKVLNCHAAIGTSFKSSLS